MRLRFITTSVALLAMLMCAPSALASLMMKLQTSGYNQMQVTKTVDSTDGETYTITTTGTDPFIYTTAIHRNLDSDERYLSFEYKSSLEIDDFQIFFGYPPSEVASQHFGSIAQADDWTVYTINITDACANFNWGDLGGKLRLDFGRVSGNNIMIRRMHIHKAQDDPWVLAEEEKVDRASIVALGLPVLDINTVDGEEPSCEYVSCPPGSMGGGITNATKVPGSLDIYLGDNTTPVYASGDYEKDVSGMTIKIRGNTSAYPDKKPYKIKLSKKADLLMRGNDKVYKDKEWVLLKDPNLLTIIGCKLSELMGLQWAPKCHYVNVIMNGDFRGLYLLMECVERNVNCRLNVADDGYIFEFDPYWWNEDGMYVNSKFTPSYNYTFKYPDFEDMTQEQIDYIQSVVTTYEQSVDDGTYPEYIDVQSFASWLLGHDIFGTYDSGGSNMYYTKYDSTDDSKIMMANMWDFDSSEQLRDQWSNLHIHRFPQFFASPNKMFNRLYVDKWNEVKATVCDDVIKFIDDFAASDEGKGFAKSIPYDNVKWAYGNPGLETEVQRTHDWFSRRKVWLDQAIAGIDTVNPKPFVKDTIASVGKTIYLQAEDYDKGGRGVAYYMHNNSTPAYRDDCEGVVIRASSNYNNGWALCDMGDGWSTEGLNLTREEAIELWGGWFNYTFSADANMQVAINFGAGVHWGSYGPITANGCHSSIIGEPDLTNWVQTYSASAILYLDGQPLHPNQTCHPANTVNDPNAYAAVLADKSKWKANSADEDVIWFYPNKCNIYTWDPYYQKDVYGEPDNYIVNISKGEHTLRVASMASQWLFDELSIEGLSATSVELALAADSFKAVAIDREIRILGADADAIAEVYDMRGQRIYSGTQRAIPVGQAGIYLVRVGSAVQKVRIR